MKNFVLIFAFCLSFLLVDFGHAQPQGYLYGTVTTWDNKTFTGQIRWGKEEAFWTDMFNASKIENEYIDLLSREDFEKFRENRGQNSNSWWNNSRMSFRFTGNESYTHQFNCQFGNIKRIERKGRSRVIVELKDGTQVKLNGDGYNDIGSSVKVYVDELGKVEVGWDDVESVTFQAAPSDFRSAIGEPLYGKVTSWDGDYEGLIQWDKDERVTSDILDGENEGRDMEIEFGNIVSLSKRGRGTEVVLKNGQSYWLDDSNDVDDGNRGIVITTSDKGRVVVDWEDFEKLELSSAPSTLKTYADFGTPEKIKAVVALIDGKSYEGEIIYDLDETYSFEILNGEKGDTEFEIAFHDISEIRPRSTGKSIVLLKSGVELLLEDSQDVSYRNTGLLLYENNQDSPIYITWDEVEQITVK